MNFHNPAIIWMRDVARSLGLVHLLRPILNRLPKEQKFSREIRRELRAGDCVWDIGANVGDYTIEFGVIVGPTGTVVAFEPANVPFQRLQQRVSDANNIRLEQVALSDSCGTAQLADGADPTMFHMASPGEEGVQIQTLTGDAFAESSGRGPNVIKLDVEGFELNVLRGLQQVLSIPTLRAIYVEVHSEEMKKRGIANGAAAVVSALEAADLKVNWIDLSHVCGRRREPRRAD